MKQGAENFGLLFMCPCTWFGVFGPNFPKLPQYPSTCETGIIRPAEGPDTRVRSHLMWNKELKTLDFLFVWLCTWFRGIWAIFPQIALMSNYPKNRYNSIIRWSWITLGMFILTWGTWVQFPQIYLMSKYPITAITWPTDSLYTRLRSDWM